MQNVVFTETQGNLIAKITGRLIADEQYKENLINSYYYCPEDLTIFEIYALEFLVKKINDNVFNRGYFNLLEFYAGDNLSYKSYDNYNDFIARWKSDAMFRDAMRARFARNDIGYLSHSVLAAHKIISLSENNMIKNNTSKRR
jgi:hypothetical protein